MVGCILDNVMGIVFAYIYDIFGFSIKLSSTCRGKTSIRSAKYASFVHFLYLFSENFVKFSVFMAAIN